MKRLITLGSQHQGIYLEGMKSWLIWGVSWLIDLVQAQFWHDCDYDRYAKEANFIATINHEGTAGQNYIDEKLMNLELFLMVVFDKVCQKLSSNKNVL